MFIFLHPLLLRAARKLPEVNLESLHGVPRAPRGLVVGRADELRGHLVAGHGAHVGGEERPAAVDVPRGQAPVTWNDNYPIRFIRNMFPLYKLPPNADVSPARADVL